MQSAEVLIEESLFIKDSGFHNWILYDIGRRDEKDIVLGAATRLFDSIGICIMDCRSVSLSEPSDTESEKWWFFAGTIPESGPSVSAKYSPLVILAVPVLSDELVNRLRERRKSWLNTTANDELIVEALVKELAGKKFKARFLSYLDIDVLCRFWT